MEMKEKLFLIDGTALAYRSYFAFINNPLVNSKGTPTSALYGVINTFLKLIDMFNPENVAISFDRKEPTFRHEMAESYKIHRPPMPDDLIIQIDLIKQFFKIIDLEEISKAGFEADDVLGTLAFQNQENYNVIIVTGDKDYAQLVNDNINIYDPRNDKIYDKQAVLDKYEINADQFIDYLALVGDASDNIPGAKGIGPKSAVALLKEFYDIDQIYNNLEKISSKSTREKLIQSKEAVDLSRILATIVVDVPLDNQEKLDFTYNREALYNAEEFLKEHELNQLMDRIHKEVRKNNLVEAEIDSVNIGNNNFTEILLDDLEKLKQVLSGIKNQDTIALDTETDSIEPLFAKLVGISFCYDTEKSYYIPISHMFAQNLSLIEVIPLIKEAFCDKLIVGHNFKFDYEVFDRHEWHIENQIFDTMLAAYVLDPGRLRLSLDNLAKQEFDYEMMPIEALIGKGKKQLTFDTVEVNTACRYSAEDSWATYRLYLRYKDQLEKNKLKDLFEKIEIPLIRVLADIEKQGVFVNVNFLRELSIKTSNLLIDLTKEIYEIAGEEFNINSTQQLSHILYENMNIKTVKKTKTGFSTDNEVLETLAEEHIIARKLIEYRQLSKLQNTYIDALPKLIKPKTGRIHSSFNQTVVSTGRLSSSNPNLQNIPIRTDLGKEIRRAICAQHKDYSIVSADYSQIELRLMALIAQDENMLNAFKNNQDIHSRTAALVFHKDISEISSEERRRAKIINFGIIYGMGAFSLSKELGIKVGEAKEFIQDYYEKFPKIINFIEKQKSFAQREGYVETMFGRRLYLPNIHSANQQVRSETERVAVNMPIQGTAADIIKIAMIRINDHFKDNDKVQMIIQVHDELVFEIQNDYLDEAIIIIKNMMEDALPKEYQDEIKLLVEVGKGTNWADAH